MILENLNPPFSVTSLQSDLFTLTPLLPLPIFTKLLQYPSRSCSIFSNLLFIWLTFILVLLLILLLFIIGLYVNNNNYNNNIKIIRITKIAATPHAHFLSFVSSSLLLLYLLFHQFYWLAIMSQC